MLFIGPIILINCFATADRGGIPIDPNVEFDEGAQNAIAAWNGTDEVLVLSTDLRSPSPGRLLEVLPLPSSPYEIKEGNVSSFKKMIELFNQKAERLRARVDESGTRAGGLAMNGEGQYTGISITFSASIGAHNVTVVHIESRAHFLDWVRDFAAGMGVANLTTASALNDSVGDHLERGICHFVFDVVELGGDQKTLNPLVYKFRTDFLYYPLNITGATLPQYAMGGHKIKVFLVMNGVMMDPYSDGLGHLSHGAGFNEFIRFTRGELGQVSRDIGALFPSDAFVCHVYNRGYGLDEEDLRDITIRPSDIRRPTADELNRQEFKLIIRPLSPSLAYYLLLSTVEPSSGPAGVLMDAMVVGMFLAPLVLGFMLRSIIEGRHLGKKGWIGWLTIYLAGAFVFSAIQALGEYFNTSGMVVVLLVPVGIALFLADLIQRNRIPYKKDQVKAVAYGMGTAQALAMLFFPNAIMAMLTGVFCFPSMLVLGPVVLLVAFLGHPDRVKRPRFSGPSPPAG